MRFESINAYGELYRIFLILFGKLPRGTGAHQSNDRKNDEQGKEAQPDQCSEKLQDAFHKYDSVRIAAYASTETEGKQ